MVDGRPPQGVGGLLIWSGSFAGERAWRKSLAAVVSPPCATAALSLAKGVGGLKREAAQGVAKRPCAAVGHGLVPPGPAAAASGDG